MCGSDNCTHVGVEAEERVQLVERDGKTKKSKENQSHMTLPNCSFNLPNCSFNFILKYKVA